MKTKKNGFSLIELLVVITIISILAAIFIPCFMRKRSEMEIETNITTISVGQLDLGIEPAKFYLVKGEWIKNHWGYDQYIQFKDIKDDKVLDQVAYGNLKIFSEFNSDTGYSSDIVLDSNSADWDKCLKMFEQVLKAHAEKLKRQNLRR